jgi:hypothetical protein
VRVDVLLKMTQEDARAVGDLAERLTRPVMTLMFGAAICWMGVRTVNNISADQFVGIVMAVVLFWFGSRPVGPIAPTTTTTTEGPGPTTTTTGPDVTPKEHKP